MYNADECGLWWKMAPTRTIKLFTVFAGMLEAGRMEDAAEAACAALLLIPLDFQTLQHL